MEEKIIFVSENYKIEGLLDKSNSDNGVVITHPHPLYGGDMYNYVVESIVGIYREKRFTTLRFNFRGVGNSQGRYEEGIGEQADVLSAISYLHDRGIKQVDLAGYSFGAWINACVSCGHSFGGSMMMVSPPVAFCDFSHITSIDSLRLVVSGSRDDIAPADMIKAMLPQWNKTAELKIIKGADHFFSGYMDEFETELNTHELIQK